MDDSTKQPSTKLNTLIDKLNKLKHFRIHTGNINTFVDLKLKSFNNSAEELKETFKLVLNNLPDDITIGDDGTLLLVDKKHCDNVYEREDLKITLKIFLEKFNFDYVRDAVDAVIKQLKTDSIEQLILSFPESDSPASETIDEKWFNEVLRIWKDSENELVSKRKVLSMGVADFQLPELDLLFQKVVHKPGIVHVFIDGCCVVNPELQAYARQNSIQLLTHNDPKPFPLKEVFYCFCEDKSDQDSSRICKTLFQPVWAARYTVWVRRRSLMAAKGFIVQFTASDATTT